MNNKNNNIENISYKIVLIIHVSYIFVYFFVVKEGISKKIGPFRYKRRLFERVCFKKGIIWILAWFLLNISVQGTGRPVGGLSW
jgi:hypothetical protein